MSMSLHRKILSAGITLHAKDNLPIRESNWHLMHLEWCNNDCIDNMRSHLRLSVMLAVIVDVSISIPRKVRRVVGPSIFGAFILWHKKSMEYVLEVYLTYECTSSRLVDNSISVIH